MKTGHLVERAFFTPLIMAAAVVACWVAFRPALQGLAHAVMVPGAWPPLFFRTVP
jgi:hypothetical protein